MLNKTIHEASDCLLNAAVKLTNRNVQQYLDMLARKDPMDRRRFVSSIRELDMRSFDRDLGAERFLLMHLREVSLHTFRPPSMRKFCQKSQLEWLAALQSSVSRLRHLDCTSLWSPVWSRLVYLCANTLESLAISHLYANDSDEQVPVFSNLKKLHYETLWPHIEIPNSILTLIGKASKLESLSAPYIAASEFATLLGALNVRVRTLTAPTSTIIEALKKTKSTTVLASLTCVKCRGISPKLNGYHDIAWIGRNLSQLQMLEFQQLNYQGLADLIKILADSHSLPHLRHIRIEHIQLAETDCRRLEETAMKILENLSKICLKRYIHLTTLTIVI